MTAPVNKVLIDGSTSPQTGPIGDGVSTAYKLWDKDDDDDILVTFSAYGLNSPEAWNGASVKFEYADEGESPLQFVPLQVMDPTAGTLTDGVVSARGGLQAVLPQGAWIRARIINSASPLPYLKVKARAKFA